MDELADLLRILVHNDLLRLQLLGHLGDLLGSLHQLQETSFQASRHGVKVLAVVLQKLRVVRQEVQEVFRRCEVAALVLGLEVWRKRGRDRQVHVAHGLVDADLVLLRQLHVGQNMLRDGEQRLVWPGEEPVDGAARHEAGEVAAAGAELAAGRRHGQHQVQVVAQAAAGERPHLRLLDALGLRPGTHGGDKRLLLVVGEERWHHAHGQDVVDVLQEALLHHVRVGKQEAHWLLDGRGVHQLQVISERIVAVAAGQGDLELLVAGGERGELRERLLAASTDSDQERHAAGHADDAVEAHAMGQGVVEEHQVHRSVVPVVQLQDAVENRADALPAAKVLVRPRVLERLLALDQYVEHVAEVAKDERVGQGHVGALRELLLDEALQLPLGQEALVRVVGEAVLVHARALVPPEAHQDGGAAHGLRIGLADALEDARQVAQAEDVVELRRGGRQVVDHGLVQLHGHLRQLHDALLHHRVEAHEAVLEDTGIDPLDRLQAGGGDAHAGVEAHHARVDRVAPSAWWLHCRDVLAVLDNELVQVPAALVHERPFHQELQERQRLLRAVRVDLGHRKVVDEDAQLLALLGPVVAARPLRDVVLHGALEVLAARARGEVDVEDGRFLQGEALQCVLQRHALRRAALPDEEHGLAGGQKLPHEPRVAGGVHGGHEDLVEVEAGGRVELLYLALPGCPAAHLHVEVRLEERLLWERLVGDVLQELVELLSPSVLQDAAQRPSKAEHVDVLH
mmetsp:Transcript_100923/g.285849  ORF Transcript_100923/g.285849 Transcript_100923/m.285849 type:complete len:741 (+) Transcript_100923:4054-6276(+)